MSTEVKVVFEIKAFGEEIADNFNSSFKGYEISREKSFSKDTTLGELENHIATIFEEVKK